ncbi:MAG: hypothetical protein ABI369_14225 [Acetobacteraceae bacterium]
MGWLFAVALGLHRGSRRAVLLALPPLALGHLLSIWLVAALVMTMGLVIDPAGLRVGAGAILLLWAAYHGFYGSRHRVRIGMTTGLAGLALWSFTMTTSQGAGLMLVPALMPLCAGLTVFGGGFLWVSLAAVGVHALATLIVTGVIALVVYDWLGLAFLRRSWINVDLLWTGALLLVGTLLVATGLTPHLFR